MQYKEIVIIDPVEEQDVIEVVSDRLVVLDSEIIIRDKKNNKLLATRNCGRFYNRALGVNRNYDCIVGKDEKGDTIIIFVKK